MKLGKLLLLSLIIISACQQPKKEKENDTEIELIAIQEDPNEGNIQLHKDTIPIIEIGNHPPENKVIEEEDCVFNNDIKGISTDWAQELESIK